MSLATRCAACGTVFRVVQDQLKVSEGWVRCGRCGDVFSALEGLFDLERESAPNWTPSQRDALGLPPASADELTAQSANSDNGPELASVSETADDTEIDTRVDSQMDTRQTASEDRDDDAVGRGEDFELEDREADLVAAAAPEPTPAFLRHADRAARWQRPRVRLALSLTAGLLCLLLAAQAALWRRDEIAAHWPQSAPTLALLCETLDCRIEALRRLDGLAVESSGLAELDGGSLYRLQVSLRNHDALPLLAPALDVTLTDSRGDVVARKILSQRESGGGADASTLVGAGAELSMQFVLDSGTRRLSGYSIEIFYP